MFPFGAVGSPAEAADTVSEQLRAAAKNNAVATVRARFIGILIAFPVSKRVRETLLQEIALFLRSLAFSRRVVRITAC